MRTERHGKIIEFDEALQKIACRRSLCADAHWWVESNGYDPMVFINGKPRDVSGLTKEEFARFYRVAKDLPEIDGIDMECAISWVTFDVDYDADMVCVFHEVLEIPRITKPITMLGEHSKRKIVLTSCDYEVMA